MKKTKKVYLGVLGTSIVATTVPTALVASKEKNSVESVKLERNGKGFETDLSPISSDYESMLKVSSLVPNYVNVNLNAASPVQASLVTESDFKFAGHNGDGVVSCSVTGLNLNISKITKLANNELIHVEVTPMPGYNLDPNQQTNFNVAVSGLELMAPLFVSELMHPDSRIIFEGDSGSGTVSLPIIPGLILTPSENGNIQNGAPIYIDVTPAPGYFLNSAQVEHIEVIPRGLNRLARIAVLEKDFRFFGLNGLGTLGDTTIMINGVPTPVWPGINVQLSKNDHLSNGDIIDVDVTPMPGWALPSSQSTHFQVTVSGLDTVSKQVVSNTSFWFTGYNGDAVINFPKIDNLVFTPSKATGISNGDEIEVQISAASGYTLLPNQSTRLYIKASNLESKATLFDESCFELVGSDGFARVKFKNGFNSNYGVDGVKYWYNELTVDQKGLIISTDSWRMLSAGNQIIFKVEAKPGYILDPNQKDQIIIDVKPSDVYKYVPPISIRWNELVWTGDNTHRRVSIPHWISGGDKADLIVHNGVNGQLVGGQWDNRGADIEITAKAGYELDPDIVAEAENVRGKWAIPFASTNFTLGYHIGNDVNDAFSTFGNPSKTWTVIEDETQIMNFLNAHPEFFCGTSLSGSIFNTVYDLENLSHAITMKNYGINFDHFMVSNDPWSRKSEITDGIKIANNQYIAFELIQYL